MRRVKRRVAGVLSGDVLLLGAELFEKMFWLHQLVDGDSRLKSVRRSFVVMERRYAQSGDTWGMCYWFVGIARPAAGVRSSEEWMLLAGVSRCLMRPAVMLGWLRCLCEVIGKEGEL